MGKPIVDERLQFTATRIRQIPTIAQSLEALGIASALGGVGGEPLLGQPAGETHRLDILLLRRDGFPGVAYLDQNVLLSGFELRL